MYMRKIAEPKKENTRKCSVNDDDDDDDGTNEDGIYV